MPAIHPEAKAASLQSVGDHARGGDGVLIPPMTINPSAQA